MDRQWERIKNLERAEVETAVKQQGKPKRVLTKQEEESDKWTNRALKQSLEAISNGSCHAVTSWTVMDGEHDREGDWINGSIRAERRIFEWTDSGSGSRILKEQRLKRQSSNKASPSAT